ncbi:Hypp1452 [Branchiostoma lanceolatum]|uniref:alpha-galactosidase n=1 Tax=Branchiostoma lanceolatum TaxID=7740 RepID=A0A8J9ZKU7_BRALA|nr:Hypp1452 [Branchiostoma lanceolatum]
MDVAGQTLCLAVVLLMTTCLSTCGRAPWGWNSYDSMDGYSPMMNETAVLQIAAAQRAQLLYYGYDHLVLDAGWFWNITASAPHLDDFGRPLPDPERFPSSKGTNGLEILARQVQDKGLKFGVWFLRGIPVQAVKDKLRIYGTQYTADQIALPATQCSWDNMNYGINTSHPAAMHYYRSITDMFSSWGVDLIKADCFYGGEIHKDEVALFSQAVSQTTRTMTLSYSPGNGANVTVAQWLVDNGYADTYRITADTWDSWTGAEGIAKQFPAAAAHAKLIGAGDTYPDLDLLPLGHLGHLSGAHSPPRSTRLTTVEQRTAMTLWCMARSPLMFGGKLPTDDLTLGLLTHKELLRLHEFSTGNHPVYQAGDAVVWHAVSTKPVTLVEHYVAFFNLAVDHSLTVAVNFTDLGLSSGELYSVIDAWDSSNLGLYKDSFSATVYARGSGLYRVIKDLTPPS